MAQKHAAAYRPAMETAYQELMNATIDTDLQRPTWGDLRSHLGKSSRKYRWPRRKCLEEIYKRSKGKQKVIWPRSNVLQQLCWTIYLT